jgi:hypothetical protein
MVRSMSLVQRPPFCGLSFRYCGVYLPPGLHSKPGILALMLHNAIIEHLVSTREMFPDYPLPPSQVRPHERHGNIGPQEFKNGDGDVFHTVRINPCRAL